MKRFLAAALLMLSVSPVMAAGEMSTDARTVGTPYWTCWSRDYNGKWFWGRRAWDQWSARRVAMQWCNSHSFVGGCYFVRCDVWVDSSHGGGCCH